MNVIIAAVQSLLHINDDDDDDDNPVPIEQNPLLSCFDLCHFTFLGKINEQQ